MSSLSFYSGKYRSSIFFILFLTIIILFLNTFSEHLKSDPKLNYKYTYYAIPISISNTVGDHYSYTQYDNIRKNIKNESHGLIRSELNKLINLSFTQQPTGPHAATVPGAEDIGLVDFVTYSFFLFGNDKDSILKFYLIILFTSIIVFYLNFYNKDEFYLITIFFLGTLILFKENFNFWHPQFVFDRYSDNRNFSILGLISYIHICFYFFFNEKNNFRNIVLLTIQIIILNFILFCRSSFLLEITLMVFIFIIFLLFKYLGTNQPFKTFLFNTTNLTKANIIIIILFCAFIMPNLNKLFISKSYNEFYHDRHPILLMLRAGLIFDNPNLKNKYEFKFEIGVQENIDVSLNNSGLKFYNEIYNKDKDKKEVFLNGGGVNIAEQSKMEKNFIIHMILNDTIELFKNFIYYKPIKIIKGFKAELKLYKTELNILKIITFFIFFIFLIMLNINWSRGIFLFFLIMFPVTIKNMFFWGLTPVYFLDLFVFYVIGIIILLFLSIKALKKIFN